MAITISGLAVVLADRSRYSAPKLGLNSKSWNEKHGRSASTGVVFLQSIAEKRPQVYQESCMQKIFGIEAPDGRFFPQ